jgi:FlgN protein
MSAASLMTPPKSSQDSALAADVIAHLDAQIKSAQSLLSVVLEQGVAIRARDVHTVVRLAGILRGEMGRRELLEEERTRLLTRSGERLGIPAQAVTLGQLCALMAPASAQRANELSAELRGLLHELQREHTANRSLMQIELGFLDHLMGILSLDGVNGYDTHGSSTPITRPRPHGGLHVLDLHA